MAYSVPDPYRQAIRNPGVGLRYTISASLDGVPVEGATELQPTGGSILDTTKEGVRRTLNAELAGSTALYDLLVPYGTTLTVTCLVQYLNRQTVEIPMGVFDVDVEKLSVGTGTLSVTAPDKWARIQRARFLGPASSTPGLTVTAQITALIRGALGASEPVNVTATSTAAVGALTWEKDRDKAIIDLAAQIGAWVYFDREGVATIADVPTVGAEANWLIDASATGVLTELDRERSRIDTRNVIVVESSAASEALFDTQRVWDDDPLSPTYAGTDPLTAADVGPFGIVVEYFDSPILNSAAAARAAGRTILARRMGLVSQVSLGQVPNPALDAFDVLDVLPPGRAVAGVTYLTGGFGRAPFGTSPFGYSAGGGGPRVHYASTQSLERHVADTVTHTLAHTLAMSGTSQHIDGRSTRTTWIEGGS